MFCVLLITASGTSLQNMYLATNVGVNQSLIGGRHGGTMGPTPAQPPHDHEHTIFDPDGVQVEVCHGMEVAEPVAVVSKVLNTGQSN